MSADMGTEASGISFELPETAARVLDVLESNGFTAWYVGGCVRDALLGRPISDVDIATSATWQDVERACDDVGIATRRTGTKHGTVTVLVPEGDSINPYEVTTFRADSLTSSDSRHPDSVEFVDTIQQDLSRRDLTINAMAWHPLRGLVDPYDGQADLRAQMIRVVGDPAARFNEDALRILRACRFASQLGFEIDGATLEAMVSHKHLLLKVSTERVVHELDLFFKGSFVHDALMRTWEVLAIVLPELCAMQGCEQNTKYHIYDVLEHTAWALQHAPDDRLSRWAVLCHDMGKPAAKFTGKDGIDHFYGHAKVSCELARGIARRLSFSGGFTESLISLVAEHGNKDLSDQRQVKRMLARLDGNVELFEALLGVMEADILAHAPEFRSPHFDKPSILRCLGTILDESAPFTVAMLEIDGNDLLDVGVEKGPRIGMLLSDALDAVIDGAVPNDHHELMRFCVARM